jgi:DNA repair exonuclease SbcCD ATPase subunit
VPTEFASVADDLYRLTPAEFVAARDAKATETRASGDRALAAAIKALRRPTQGAWMVNWLARERGADLGRLLELGEALRRAQDQMAGEELRALAHQRHAVVAALAETARHAAAEIGMPAGESAARDVEDTLNAALADDQAAAAVRAGHLSTALHYSGFGAEPRGPSPLPTSIAPEAPTDGRRPGPATAERQRKAESQRKRQLEEAEAALEAVQEASGEARRRADDHARELEDAKEQLDQLRQSIEDLEARLKTRREEDRDATLRLRDIERAREDADRVATDLETQRAAAAARLEELRSRGGDPLP